jgi:hypothetical protein
MMNSNEYKGVYDDLEQTGRMHAGNGETEGPALKIEEDGPQGL